MRDYRDAKAMAQSLREALAAKTISITHGESLELVSRMLGLADWNTLSALIKDNPLKPGAAGSARNAPRAGARTLVLIPPQGGDAAAWNRTIAALEGVDTLVGNTFEDDTLEGIARRILGDAPPNFCLAGVSMGGMVALEIMRLAPERVRGLALIDTSAYRAAPVSEEGSLKYHQRNAAIMAGMDMRAFARKSVAGTLHPDAPQDLRDDLVEMMVRVGAATYARQYFALSERQDHRPVLATIQIPTLVVHGANDRLTPIQLSQRLHRAVAGSELHIIPDCAHLPPMEAPREMARLLKGLLEQAA